MLTGAVMLKVSPPPAPSKDFIVPTDHSAAALRSVMPSASMKSRVMTEYATGVSSRLVASRPPASADDATNPVSLSVVTSNGERTTVSADLDGAGSGALGIGGVCAWRSSGVRKGAPRQAEARAADRRLGIMGIRVEVFGRFGRRGRAAAP